MLKKRLETACRRSYRMWAADMSRKSGNDAVADEEQIPVCPMYNGIPVLSGISQRKVTWIGDFDSDLYREERRRINRMEKRDAAIRLTLLSDSFEAPACSRLDFILDYAVGFKPDIPSSVENVVTDRMVWEQFRIKVKVVNSLSRRIAAFYENCTKYKAKSIELATVLGQGIYQYRVDPEYRISYRNEPVSGELSVPLIMEAYCTAYKGNREDGSLRQGSLTRYSGSPDERNQEV